MPRGVASHAAKRGALPVLCSWCLCAAAASGREDDSGERDIVCDGVPVQLYPRAIKKNSQHTRRKQYHL
ncbi:hypothetical protein CUR178_00403 [Leishmania enriettii]|uniref:Secreted protein n=1 Tax=Leishmania enriettii TaxID=5663 RepID=A0A836G0W8_LEIEN|nr:hypothetical protein CUR178_00403 [Leishmania enriettii]